MLSELGCGDHRFSGTSFGRGECDFQTFLQQCCDAEQGKNLPPGKVPQGTFWLVGAGQSAVGIVRVRPQLDERLFLYGGNIGYYVRSAERGRGYGRLALKLGLEELKRRGVNRALITVNPANLVSIRVALANGGIQDVQGTDPVTGEVVNRYWIALKPA
jgi:predicted acetyltransferase